MAIIDKLKHKLKTIEKTKPKATDDKPAPVKNQPVKKETAPAPVKNADKEMRAAKYAHILRRPRITEKSTEANQNNQYIFDVSPQANKTDVMAAIKAIYEVKPLKVNIVNTAGKPISWGRISGRRRNCKKAIVKLPAGKTLDIYEGV